MLLSKLLWAISKGLLAKSAAYPLTHTQRDLDVVSLLRTAHESHRCEAAQYSNPTGARQRTTLTLLVSGSALPSGCEAAQYHRVWRITGSAEVCGRSTVAAWGGGGLKEAGSTAGSPQSSSNMPNIPPPCTPPIRHPVIPHRPAAYDAQLE